MDFNPGAHFPPKQHKLGALSNQTTVQSHTRGGRKFRIRMLSHVASVELEKGRLLWYSAVSNYLESKTSQVVHRMMEKNISPTDILVLPFGIIQFLTVAPQLEGGSLGCAGVGFRLERLENGAN